MTFELTVREKIMVRFVVLVVAAAFTISATDIVVSRDSLRVTNDFPVGAGWDSLTITNNGVHQVSLDSARVVLSEWATGFETRSMNQAQGMLVESGSGVRMVHYFKLDSIGTSEFRCVFGASSLPRVSIEPSGDSVILGALELGWNFFGAVPVYPQYIQGVLRLYFSNGEVVSLNIYSNDLRTAARGTSLLAATRRGSPTALRRFLINGQMVADGAGEAIRLHGTHRLYTFPSIK